MNLKETKRDKVKDAVRVTLEEFGLDVSTAYELACQVADELEGN
jgi:hypothetical protein